MASTTSDVRFSGISLEGLACVAILGFFGMQGAIPFIAPNQALESTNSVASGLTLYGGIASQAIVYGVIVCLVLSRAQRMIRWLCAMQWTAGLSLLAIASTVWSQFPLITLRRSLPFTMAGLFGLYFAARFPLRRQLSIVTMTMGLLAVGTIFLAVCLPKIGLDASPGHRFDWQGVFTQKNACGRAMVLATAAILSKWRLSLGNFGCLVLFLLVLLMSGSRGAWAIEAVVLAFCGWGMVANPLESRSRIVFLVVTACVATVFAGVVLYQFRVLLPFIGRDASLSGRTEIWKQAWRFILERPVLGWGYAAFWRGLEGESFKVAAALHYVVFHAHNGFLEMWLELGLPGLTLFAFSYLRAWRRLWPVLRSGDMRRGTWMALFLVLILLYNLDESTLLTFNGLSWMLYVSVVANIELISAEERLQARIHRIADCLSTQDPTREGQWLEPIPS